MNVLILCEESQEETKAFRKIGINAFSLDLLPAKKGTPVEWHIIDDARNFWSNNRHCFFTQDNKKHKIKKWDLVIAHPPCTYLSRAGATYFFSQKIPLEERKERFDKMKQAREFFFFCLNLNVNYLLVENPIPLKIAQLPKPSFWACPSWFGDKYTKKTYYWAKNLPPLMPTCFNTNTKSLVHCSRGKYRSRTRECLADAIATQYVDYIRNTK